MNQQLNIPFPQYCFDMKKQKEGMLLAEIESLKKKIEHQAYTIRTYKGHFTKNKNKTK
jgi:hypothetical protein